MRLTLSILALAALLTGLNLRVGPGFKVGELLDPAFGLYRTAAHPDRYDDHAAPIANLDADVRIVRDDRGVPHIFAETDPDAVRALGYAVAQDRLFQMDFIARTATARLSEVLGQDGLETDLFFSGLGMPWAVWKNTEWLHRSGSDQLDLITWFQEGANAWIERLDARDYPFEFRLFGYEPEPFTPEAALAVLAYMTYDLSFNEIDKTHTALQERLSPEAYRLLFPRHSPTAIPIVPGYEAPSVSGRSSPEATQDGSNHAFDVQRKTGRPGLIIPDGSVKGTGETRPLAHDTGMLEGWIPGKGSNNWAVDGTRSSTGYPILAGDMHLNLSLPSIWYEVHLVTPTMNVYGVTIPGAPVVVEGVTPETAWAFTNTGADQIDYYRLEVATGGDGYILDGRVKPFERWLNELKVAGGETVVDTLVLSRFGPVTFDQDGAMAMRWVGHDTTRTLQAIWGMGHARTYEEFVEATRYWDAPMQNILFASHDGTVAIRSTGFLPLRAGVDGAVVLDGTTERNAWIGRVPFDELPASVRPERGYATSTNQEPAGPAYPYYLGHNWGDGYRSMRIDALLAQKDRHGVDDIMSYQADVHALQWDLFVPMLGGLEDLSEEAAVFRDALQGWDGDTSIQRSEPILLDLFLDRLEDMMWDEPEFNGTRTPHQSMLYVLLRDDPTSLWFDRVDTEAREDANDLLALTLESIAAAAAPFMAGAEGVPGWGDVHTLVIRHFTRSTKLEPLWRGPFPYPGFNQTLSPASSMRTTHSASWRVVVDLSTVPPKAHGIYPGGQSGNPFSRRYDDQIQRYLDFEYNELLMPQSPEQLSPDRILHAFTLRPSI